MGWELSTVMQTFKMGKHKSSKGLNIAPNIAHALLLETHCNQIAWYFFTIRSGAGTCTAIAVSLTYCWHPLQIAIAVCFEHVGNTEHGFPALCEQTLKRQALCFIHDFKIMQKLFPIYRSLVQVKVPCFVTFYTRDISKVIV